MSDINSNILVSSPNSGGLFIIKDKEAIKIDNIDTTGLFFSDGVLLRGEQPEKFSFYKDAKISEFNSYENFHDIHDVLIHKGEFYIVCTTGNFIIKLDEYGTELERWSYGGEDDSRHINCLTVWNDRVVFSAFGDFYKTREYKKQTKGRGYVEDLLTGERLIDGLSQPHSPVTIGSNLIIASSEDCEIREYSKDSKLVRAKNLGGYTRGLCIVDEILYVGLSKSRNLDDKSPDSATLVGLDLNSWQETFRIPLSSNEIYSVINVVNSSSIIDILTAISSQNTQINDDIEDANQQQKFKFELKIDELELSIENKKEILNEKEGCLNNLKDVNSDLLKEIDILKVLNSSLGDKCNAYEGSLERESSQNAAIVNSYSWRVTKPLRYFNCAMMRAKENILSFELRDAWHNLPMSTAIKLKIKSTLFGLFPFIFKNTDAYSAWYNINNIDEGDWSINNNQPMQVIGSNHFVPKTQLECPQDLPARLLAFYLPQFHEIKENNEWWGEGFTEWTNVKSGTPQFEGHYQPHEPGDLGYYNLLDVETQRQQIELAKLYGIGGFVFYYYWFAGKRLLEQPIENYLSDESLDHPFCLCWANENWCRRWDGRENEILISQEHSNEDDIAFATDVLRYMKDPRYIRVDGKPLLIVYRPSLLPSSKKTVKRWREYFRDNGIGEIYLAYTQSFESFNPKRYGFDAAIEFPPNNSTPPNITKCVKPVSDSFTGNVFDWSIFLERSKKWKKSSYRLYRSVCPSWDNTARRKSNGTIFANSNPDDYQKWLENAIDDTCQNIKNEDERLVFVNAWNEWAEGAHLEPDLKYGYAWLEASRKALTGERDLQSKKKIAVISHDAHPHGAQFLALGLVKSLAKDLKFNVSTVLLGEGRLRSEFQRYSIVHELFIGNNYSVRASLLAKRLKDSGIEHALVNTTVSGSFIKYLAEQGIKCVSLIHEMPEIIQNYSLEKNTINITSYASKIVFPAEIVADGFDTFSPVHASQKVIRPQGVWRKNSNRHKRDIARADVREHLGLKAQSKIVLSVGYADYRKGVDLFARVALELIKEDLDIVFVWIGHWDSTSETEVQEIISGYEDSFRFVGYEPDTEKYHLASDVYALTSREDPFPNVVLESFDAGVPVVAFEGSGGAADLIGQVCGLTVPRGDLKQFSNVILSLLKDSENSKELGSELAKLVDNKYLFKHYVFDLCDLLDINQTRVSVIVPNYNYADLIKERLDSIIAQSIPIYELIILDDCSTDGSVKEIHDWISKNDIECRLIINEVNSGSVFKQWKKGLEYASGDVIWIAEADDIASPRLLEAILEPLANNEDVVLSYCDSIQIDKKGSVLANSYYEYTKDLSESHWLHSYNMNGRKEVADFLAIKNTIPNVSSVLFRADVIKDVFESNFDNIGRFQSAGDWITYALVLEKGNIAFSPQALNKHRRHTCSVIGGGSAIKLVDEIERAQEFVRVRFQLDENIVLKSSDYISQLKKQFRLVD